MYWYRDCTVRYNIYRYYTVKECTYKCTSNTRYIYKYKRCYYKIICLWYLGIYECTKCTKYYSWDLYKRCYYKDNMSLGLVPILVRVLLQKCLGCNVYEYCKCNSIIQCEVITMMYTKALYLKSTIGI